MDKPAVTSEPRVEPMLVVKETRADKQEDHSDMKSRILQAAQQYMVTIDACSCVNVLIFF